MFFVQHLLSWLFCQINCADSSQMFNFIREQYFTQEKCGNVAGGWIYNDDVQVTCQVSDLN